MTRLRYFRHDAFLSHNREDGSIELCRRLSEVGVSAWHDGDANMAELAVHRAVAAALADSRYICVCVGPGFRNSQWVRAEYTYAMETGRVLVVEMAPGGAIPEALKDQRRFAVSDGLDPLASFLKVCNAYRPADLVDLRTAAMLTWNEVEQLREETRKLRSVVLAREVRRKLQLGDDIGLEVSKPEQSKLERQYRRERLNLALQHGYERFQDPGKSSAADIWLELTGRNLTLEPPRPTPKSLKSMPISSERQWARAKDAPPAVPAPLSWTAMLDYSHDEVAESLCLQIFQHLTKHPKELRRIVNLYSSRDFEQCPLHIAALLLGSHKYKNEAALVHADMTRIVSRIIGKELTQLYLAYGQDLSLGPKAPVQKSGSKWHAALSAAWQRRDQAEYLRFKCAVGAVFVTLFLVLCWFIAQ